MTTKAAADLYLYEHLQYYKGRPKVVYNPNNLPIEELPFIYGFNNGGGNPFWSAIAVAEDGTELSGHLCSDEGYMPSDLGVIEGGCDRKHEESYKPHYPNGYKMEFVGYDDVKSHEGLMKAIKIMRRKD